ncbi:MAG: hypothetical protein JXM70_00705 [Pirellulales bacterium]|nr:hypothetical protein [Pirellulales bacterium]
MTDTREPGGKVAVGDSASDEMRALRWSVYVLLITLSVGTMLGRIFAVDAVDRSALQEFRIREEMKRRTAEFKKKGLEGEKLTEAIAELQPRVRVRYQMQRPFLSANDRSRWCTVRALVEEEMRVEGAPYSIDKVTLLPNWDTIDMVKHDGHLYSSKPPLFPTLVAGEYWLIHKLTGATLKTRPYAIARFMLITINVVPLVIAMLLLACLVERLGTTNWGRIFVMGAAAFGTFLTTFSIVLNNHLPGAISAIIAVYAVVRVWFDDDRRLRHFFIAGLFAAFTAANELPALALLAGIAAGLLWKAPKQTLLAFVPGVLVVAAAFFTTNWIAHKSLAPPYMHRSGEGEENWYDYTYEKNGCTVESYWRNPKGLDRKEESSSVYALHSLVGHHGIFSLTPIWLLSIVGTLIWLFQRRDPRLRQLAFLIGSVSLVCVIFFVFIESSGRNYGGMNCGFRWVFWFAPLWLLMLLPAVDWMARSRWTQAVALVLLTVSVLSAAYPTWNVWSHPWLLNYLHYLGWIHV